MIIFRHAIKYKYKMLFVIYYWNKTGHGMLCFHIICIIINQKIHIARRHILDNFSISKVKSESQPFSAKISLIFSAKHWNFSSLIVRNSVIQNKTTLEI